MVLNKALYRITFINVLMNHNHLIIFGLQMSWFGCLAGLCNLLIIVVIVCVLIYYHMIYLGLQNDGAAKILIVQTTFCHISQEIILNKHTHFGT